MKPGFLDNEYYQHKVRQFNIGKKTGVPACAAVVYKSRFKQKV